MRVRLDIALVERGLVESREQAKRLILAGAVRVNGQVGAKPSDAVVADAQLEIAAPEKFVSRGGHKLEAALDALAITVQDAVCLDIGASTGGFTDCLLQRGARRVYAIDVGKGQLDYRLRQDPRVVVREGVNARYLTAEIVPEAVDIITVDVSFISLEKVLGPAVERLTSGGRLVALIKPQFEAGREHVKKGGVVRDATVHENVKTRVKQFATETLRLKFVGLVDSPLLGPAGNKEFLIVLQKP